MTRELEATAIADQVAFLRREADTQLFLAKQIKRSNYGEWMRLMQSHYDLLANAESLEARGAKHLTMLPTETPADERGLWKHERAHCNGWHHPEDQL